MLVKFTLEMLLFSYFFEYCLSLWLNQLHVLLGTPTYIVVFSCKGDIVLSICNFAFFMFCLERKLFKF